MGWFSEFYTSLLYVSNIGANSFAEYQFDASNSEEDKYFNKEKALMLCTMRFEKIKIQEGVVSSKKSKRKIIT